MEAHPVAVTPVALPPGGYAGFLRAGASRWSGRVALRFEGRSWTYAELDAWVDRTASGLAGHDVGGRVAVLADNRPEHLVAQLALARIGVPFVTPGAAWTEHELRPLLRDVAATAVVGEGRFSHLHARFHDIDDLPSSPVPPPRLDDDPDAEAYVPFSSGTTGPPKGVRHTRSSLCGAVLQLVAHLGLDTEDRVPLALPLSHVFGATVAAATIAAGAELTLHRRLDLDDTLEQLGRGRITLLPIAGSTAHALAARTDLGPLPALRYFLWGGSAVPAVLAADITGRTGVGFLTSYGMTEAVVVAFNPVDHPDRWRLDSPGPAALGTELRTTDAGELEVRGASVAAGYATTSGVDEQDRWSGDGWFRTGDLGHVDEEGRITVVDRVKDMLKVSGFAVSPVEVEQAMLELDAVRDCGVHGEPDPRRGQVVVATVVGQVDEAALRSWASIRLARYKQPQRYVFVDALPRSPAGKLLRRDLGAATRA